MLTALCVALQLFYVTYQIHSYRSSGTIEYIFHFGTIDYIYAFNRTKTTLVLRKCCTPPNLCAQHHAISIFAITMHLLKQQLSDHPEAYFIKYLDYRTSFRSNFVSVSRRSTPLERTSIRGWLDINNADDATIAMTVGGPATWPRCCPSPKGNQQSNALS